MVFYDVINAFFGAPGAVAGDETEENNCKEKYFSHGLMLIIKNVVSLQVKTFQKRHHPKGNVRIYNEQAD